MDEILKRIFDYEATASVANTGTGSRREGEGFEKLMTDFWSQVADLVKARSDHVSVVRHGNRKWWCLKNGCRSLYLPCHVDASLSDADTSEHRWLDLVFPVQDLVAGYPGTSEAIDRFAPEVGPFAGSKYPSLHSGLSTKFDDTILLVADGVLVEKILLEYKTAKSSTGRQIDGNAHERLSFQTMQYLEVAPRYTRCSFLVMTNGAFVKYRNKYHVSFHIQAERLRNFAWFNMTHVCTPAEYQQSVAKLLAWFDTGVRS
ncbi:MAG: hypothetical protein ABL962_04715 [Fimbriimonadaceae bacterium]